MAALAFCTPITRPNANSASALGSATRLIRPAFGPRIWRLIAN
jgi:hypothetical protein